MADGITFVKERIKILEAEIARLKDCARQSETLFAEVWLGPVDGAAGSKEKTGKSAKSPAVHHLWPTSNGSGTGGEDVERHVLTLLSTKDLGNTPVRLNGEGRDRKRIFRQLRK